MVTIYRHVNVNKLSIGAVVTDSRGWNALHTGPNTWLVRIGNADLDEAVGVFVYVSTDVLELPVTLDTARKETAT